jgi:hypothetical protein
VFENINKIKSLDGFTIREIGIGIDYGSVNPTTFVPIALCYHHETRQWKVIRLEIYYHNPEVEDDTPTTEYYSWQLRLFITYLKDKYANVPITEIDIDSEASHFDNRLTTDGIRHSISKKGAGSVDRGVQQLQSLFYKEFLYIYEQPSIKMFDVQGNPVYCVRDESLNEFESYQYDNVRSIATGTNVYKKELDHTKDASRYLIDEWQRQGKCPVI